MESGELNDNWKWIVLNPHSHISDVTHSSSKKVAHSGTNLDLHNDRSSSNTQFSNGAHPSGLLPILAHSSYSLLKHEE